MSANSRPQSWRRSAKQQPGESLYRIELTFDDNRKLADVLGEFDANLALIESKLGVKAVVHGNVVVLDGGEESCILGKTVLETLYRRAGSGTAIAQGDVDGALRHLTNGNSGALPGFKSPEPFPSFGELKTRKRTI